MELSVFASTILYLAIFSASILFAYLGHKKDKKSLIALAIILPVLLASFRYATGTDSLTYRAFYEEIGNEDFERTMVRFESGSIEPFVIVASLIGNFLNLPPSFLFFAFAIITVVFMYATARLFNKEHAWLYYGMLLLVVFPESLNMMRQIAAISVQGFALMHIFKSIQDEKRIHWAGVLALLALSITLHYSSYMLLPVFLLPFAIKYMRGRVLAFLLIAAAMVCMATFPFLLNFIVKTGLLSERHLATFMSIKGSLINIKFVGAVIMSGVLLANYHRRKESYDKQLGLLMLLGISYSAVGFYSGYLGRLAMFFWIFIIIVFGETLSQLFEKENHRIAACMAVAIGYFVLYYVVFGLSEIMPYSFAF